MFGILMFGLMAYRLLPVSDLPNVDFPTITVSAGLPGASPQTMAAAVATPLEKQFSTIAGIDAMTSTSTMGSSNITLTFSLSREIDAAAQDVQAAISKTLRQLPPGIQPPSYNKSNPADSPILYLALTSATMPLSALDEYAETFLAQRLSTVDGVAQVQVFGSAKYAVRIQVDPKALQVRGIGLDEASSPMPRTCSAFGSTWMRTAYFADPNTCTCATPSTVESRCARNVSAYSSSADSGIVAEVSAR